jgi:hypothetical protein
MLENEQCNTDAKGWTCAIKVLKNEDY